MSEFIDMEAELDGIRDWARRDAPVTKDDKDKAYNALQQWKNGEKGKKDELTALLWGVFRTEYVGPRRNGPLKKEIIEQIRQDERDFRGTMEEFINNYNGNGEE